MDSPREHQHCQCYLDLNKPALTHKWCEVHQDGLLASRGYYRLASTLLLAMVCFQQWKNGTSIWVMLPVWLALWGAHLYTGRKVEDLNYLRAEKRWNETHPDEQENDHG